MVSKISVYFVQSEYIEQNPQKQDTEKLCRANVYWTCTVDYVVHKNTK